MQADGVLTVSELNEYVRRALASDPMLRGVRLRGEISNYKRHSSGHLFFAIKDESCRIACVMYRHDAISLRFEPTDGMMVTLEGNAALYAQGGAFQFYAARMEKGGAGDWHLRFERLKELLYREGLFDASTKRPLPASPRVVGIVTSDTGAVLHDITRVGWRRNPGQMFLLRPSAVQGEGAGRDIEQGIAELSRVKDVDVIIIGRGGGSIEDLWAFNEERVARAIRACPLPVVSAVGHETDVTIADFAADVRAATPSAAAELCVPDRTALVGDLATLERAMQSAVAASLDQRGQALLALELALKARDPVQRLETVCGQFARLTDKLHLLATHAMDARESALDQLISRLNALNPSGLMARGFAYVTREGVPLCSAEQAQAGDAVRITLRDGALRARVEEIMP